jgi:hypothetical protein
MATPSPPRLCPIQTILSASRWLVRAAPPGIAPAATWEMNASVCPRVVVEAVTGPGIVLLAWLMTM